MLDSRRAVADPQEALEAVRLGLEELGPLVEAAPAGDGPAIRHPAELLLNETEQQVLATVGTEATSIDQIIADTGLPVQQVLSTLSVLEMRRLIRRLSGTMVSRP